MEMWHIQFFAYTHSGQKTHRYCCYCNVDHIESETAHTKYETKRKQTIRIICVFLKRCDSSEFNTMIVYRMNREQYRTENSTVQHWQILIVHTMNELNKRDKNSQKNRMRQNLHKSKEDTSKCKHDEFHTFQPNWVVCFNILLLFCFIIIVAIVSMVMIMNRLRIHINKPILTNWRRQTRNGRETNRREKRKNPENIMHIKSIFIRSVVSVWCVMCEWEIAAERQTNEKKVIYIQYCEHRVHTRNFLFIGIVLIVFDLSIRWRPICSDLSAISSSFCVRRILCVSKIRNFFLLSLFIFIFFSLAADYSVVVDFISIFFQKYFFA